MRALRILGWVALGLFAFVLTFWLTWPSDAVANRIRHEVRRATNGEMDLVLAATSPIWVGLGSRDVMAYRTEGGERLPFFGVDRAWASVAPLSLLGSPEVSGGLALEDGRLDTTLSLTGLGAKARVAEARVEGSALPISDLLALARGLGNQVPVVADGGVDVDVSLALGDKWTEAVGDVALRGDALSIESLELPGMGELALDAAVDALELVLRLENGKADVVEGKIRTSLADVDIEGEIELADKLSRSRMDLKVTLTLRDWSGTPLESFRSLLEKQMDVAKGDDDRYHYALSGLLGRIDGGSLRPDRQVRRRSRGGADEDAEGTPTRTVPRLGGQLGGAGRNTTGAVSDETREILDRIPPPRRRASSAARRPSRGAEGEEDLVDEGKEQLGYVDEDELDEEEIPLDDEEALEQAEEEY